MWTHEDTIPAHPDAHDARTVRGERSPPGGEGAGRRPIGVRFASDSAGAPRSPGGASIPTTRGAS